ncbi:efflux RND transporter periplasmic adaptor subunit [Bremerella cremea]|uniref:Efflux RND transporter periplasmic adaptor subunit n=1 Tax=Bremerella cremea TaxID=1031537 RepID=A0A368KZ12_9BACT|nr:efflux RND transporter periplasmic adaptor subunit [Bremerella cremea]RCS56009.1 efflux RND transporter periplasmic adaptor subunit [Bremerella cremea]
MNTTYPYFSLASIVLTLAIVLPLQAQGKAAPPAPVRTAVVQQKEIATQKPFVGTVRPTQQAILGSAVDGRVIEFNYEEGDRVENGAAIAQLLTQTINLQWEAAKAELNVRKAELEELENGTRPEEIEQMKARMLAAEARKRYLELRRKRAEDLYNNQKVTSAEVRDEAVSAADAAIQAYLEAKAAYDLGVAGPRAEQIAQAKARVAMQQAVTNELEDRIKKYTIRTRFDGYIVKKATEVGAWASAGGPIAEVAHLDSVDLVANVPEQDIPYVQVGREVTVVVFAYKDKPFKGTVFSINPSADVRSRTFPVKIRVKNEMVDGKPMLKSGMMGNVLLQAGERKTATLVPKDAIVLGGAAPMLYVVVKSADGMTVKPVAVKVGEADESLIEVIGEVQPGDQVVTRGNERLRPGQAITIIPPTESQSVGS